MYQAFCQSLYLSQTCNLQAEFVDILSTQSRQTNSACRLQVWLKYKDWQNACWQRIVSYVLIHDIFLQVQDLTNSWILNLKKLVLWWDSSRDSLLLADVALHWGMYPAGKVDISRQLVTPALGSPRVTILLVSPVQTLVHCEVKYNRPPDLKSSLNVSLPFAWITGPGKQTQLICFLIAEARDCWNEILDICTKFYV